MKNLSQSQFMVEIQKLSNELALEVFSSDLKNRRISPERTLTITEILFLEFPTALVDFRETQRQGHRRWKNLIGQAIKTGELKAIDGHIVSGHYHIWRNGQCRRPADSIIEKVWINPAAPTPVAEPAAAPAPPDDVALNAMRNMAQKGHQERYKARREYYAETAERAVSLALGQRNNDGEMPKNHEELTSLLFDANPPPPGSGATRKGLLKAIKNSLRDNGCNHLIRGQRRKKNLE